MPVFACYDSIMTPGTVVDAQRPSLPDATGHFGPYGGVFVPETLIFALRLGWLPVGGWGSPASPSRTPP